MYLCQQSCLLKNPTSFQKAGGLNLIKTERVFFYLQSGLKHNTSVCALQLTSVNVYDLFFFSIQGSFLPCNSSTWGGQQVKGIFLSWGFCLRFGRNFMSQMQARVYHEPWAKLEPTSSHVQKVNFFPIIDFLATEKQFTVWKYIWQEIWINKCDM